MNHVKDLVLTIEDSDDHYLFIKRAFDKSGYGDQIERVKNGEEAIQRVQDLMLKSEEDGLCRHLILLLDLNMPGVDGYQVLQRLKQEKSTRFIPIIIFTSSSADVDIDTCFRHGANGYIVKPFDFQEFQNHIKCLCEYWLDMNERPPLMPKEAWSFV